MSQGKPTKQEPSAFITYGGALYFIGEQSIEYASFGEGLSDAFAKFASEQKDIGHEFEQALIDNLSDLYECEPVPRHWSDCSVYNAPAYPPGPCDCNYPNH